MSETVHRPMTADELGIWTGGFGYWWEGGPLR